MSISFSGLASGLDTSSWVKSLTALKQAKVTTLQEQKENVVLSRNTLNNIKSFFSTFRSLLEKVTDTKFNIASMDLFAQNIAKSANVDIVTATATTEAQEGKYEIKVDKLATNTQAVSRYNYTTTIVETSVATNNSTLKSLGVKSGEILVEVNDAEYGMTITEDETIGSFAKKLQDLGVNANFNEKTGIFSMNIDANKITDIGNTGIVDALHLSATNQGYKSNALSYEKVETYDKLADGSTKLKDLGVNAGTLKIQANDAEYDVILEDDDSIQDLIDALYTEGIDASITDGVFSITNAVIISDGETNLINALGLTTPSISSSSQLSGALSYQTTVTTTSTATLDTELSDLGVTVNDGDKIVVKDDSSQLHTITLEATSTIDDVFRGLRSAGLTASIDSDGRITIEGGEILTDESTFDAVNAFDLTSKVTDTRTFTMSGSSPLYTQGSEVTANSSTTLETIGITDSDVLNIKDSEGNITGSYSNLSDKTIDELLQLIEDNSDIETSFEDGIISLTSPSGSYIDGDIADSLGIAANPVTTTVSSSQSSTGGVGAGNTYQQTVTADADTSLQDLQLVGKEYNIVDKDGNTIVTTTTGETTLGELFESWKNDYGFNASIENGVITIDNSNGMYLTGELADSLGIGTNSYTGETVTTGTDLTSTAPATYTETTTNTTDVTTTVTTGGSNTSTIPVTVETETTSVETTTTTTTIGGTQTSSAPITFTEETTTIPSITTGGTITSTATVTLSNEITEYRHFRYENSSSAAVLQIRYEDGSIVEKNFSGCSIEDVLNFIDSNTQAAATLLDGCIYINYNLGDKFTITGGEIADYLGIQNLEVTGDTHGSAISNGVYNSGTLTANTYFVDLVPDRALPDMQINSIGRMTVVSGNTESVITINTDDKVQDLMNELNAKGFTTSITDGKLTIAGSEGIYIKGIDSTLAGALNLDTSSLYTQEAVITTTTAGTTNTSTTPVTYTTETTTTNTTYTTTTIGGSETSTGSVTYTETVTNNTENTVTTTTGTTNTSTTPVTYTVAGTTTETVETTSTTGVSMTSTAVVTYTEDTTETTTVYTTTTSAATQTSASVITYQKETAITGDTKLNEFLDYEDTFTLRNSDGTTSQYNLSELNGGSSAENLTVNELLSLLQTEFGGTASLANDGTITLDLDQGTVSGGIFEQMGITEESQVNTTTSVSSLTTGGPITYTSISAGSTTTATVTATSDSTFEELGMTGLSGTIKDANSNTTYELAGYASGSTLQDFINDISTKTSGGLTASLANGVITLTSNDGTAYYVDGDLFDAMGITSTVTPGEEYTVTTPVSTLQSSSAITYTSTIPESTTTTTVTATLDSTFKELGLTNLSGVVKDANGGTIANISTFAADATLQDFINTMSSQADTTVTLNNGVLSFNTPDGYYVEGELFDAMGVTSTITPGEEYTVTTPVANVSSSKAITYTSVTPESTTTNTSVATEATTFGQLELDGYSYSVFDNEGQFVTQISYGTEATLGDFIDDLGDYNINATITDGVISFESEDGYYINGALAELMGITSTVTPGEEHTTTAGVSTLTSTAPVTYTGTIPSSTYTNRSVATEATTFGELGLANVSYTVYNNEGSPIVTMDSGFSEDQNLGTFISYLDGFGITATLTDGVFSFESENGYYIAGDLADAMGITTTQEETGNTITSPASGSISSTAAVTYTSVTAAVTGQTGVAKSSSSAITCAATTTSAISATSYYELTYNKTIDENDLVCEAGDYYITIELKNTSGALIHTDEIDVSGMTYGEIAETLAGIFGDAGLTEADQYGNRRFYINNTTGYEAHIDGGDVTMNLGLADYDIEMDSSFEGGDIYHDAVVEEDTTWGELFGEGWQGQTYDILTYHKADGTTGTITVDDTDTMTDTMNAMSAVGLNLTVDEGKFTISSNTAGVYVEEINQDFSGYMGFIDDDVFYTVTTGTTTATLDTTLADLGCNIESGAIIGLYNGNVTLTNGSSTTIGELVSLINNSCTSMASFDNGIFTINPPQGTYIRSDDNNIFSYLNISNVTETTTYTRTPETTTTITATSSTTIGQIGGGSGVLTFSNGNTFNYNTDTTINEIISALYQNGNGGSSIISADGILSIGLSEGYIVSDSGNLLSALHIDEDSLYTTAPEMHYNMSNTNQLIGETVTTTPSSTYTAKLDAMTPLSAIGISSGTITFSDGTTAEYNNSMTFAQLVGLLPVTGMNMGTDGSFSMSLQEGGKYIVSDSGNALEKLNIGATYTTTTETDPATATLSNTTQLIGKTITTTPESSTITTIAYTSTIRLSDIGVTDQGVLTFSDGNTYTYNSSTSMAGIVLSLGIKLNGDAKLTDGVLTFSQTDSKYIVSDSGNFLEKMGISTTYNTSTETTDATTTTSNSSVLMADEVTTIPQTTTITTVSTGNTLGDIGITEQGIITFSDGFNYTYDSSTTLMNVGLAFGLHGSDMQSTFTNGVFSVTQSDTKYAISDSGNLLEKLKITGPTYTTSTETTPAAATINSSSVLMAEEVTMIDPVTTTVTMTETTTLDALGIGGGTITLSDGGTESYTSTMTVGQIIGLIEGHIGGAAFSDGQLRIDQDDAGYIIGDSGNLLTRLGIDYTEGFSTSSTTVYSNSTTNINSIGNATVDTSLTSATTLADLNLVGNNYTVTVFDGATEKTLTLDSTKSLSDLTTFLNNNGLSASISEGKLTIAPNTQGAYIKSMDSTLAGALGLDANSFYTTNVTSEEVGSGSVIEHTLTVDTTFGDLGFTGTEEYITYRLSDGAALSTFTISTTTTVGEYIDYLNGHEGIEASITDGKFNITLPTSADGQTPIYNGYIEGKNILPLLGIDQTVYTYNTTVSETTTEVPTQTTVTMTGETTFAELFEAKNVSANNQVVTVVSNGSEETFTINVTGETKTTVNDFMSWLDTKGFDVSLTDGKLTIDGNDNAYYTDMNNVVENVLNLTNTNGYTTNESTTGGTVTDTVTHTMSGTTTFGQLYNSESVNETVTIVNNGTTVTTAITSATTVNDLLNWFSDNGFTEASVADGRITITGKENVYLVGISNSLNNILKLDGEISNTENVTSSTETTPTIGAVTINSETTFATIGLSSQQVVTVISNGTQATYTINANGGTENTKVGEFINWMQDKGFEASLTDGVVTIKGNSSAYYTDLNDNVENALNLNDAIGYKTTEHEANTPVTTTIIKSATEDSSFGDIGLEEDAEEIVTVINNGTTVTTTITAETKVGDFVTWLNNNGMTASLQNGRFTVSGDEDSYTTGFSTNINYLLKLNGNTNNTVSINETSTTHTITTTETIDENTTFEQIGFTDGQEEEFVVNGKNGEQTITVKSTDTIGSFIAQMTSAGFEASLTDGVFTISGDENIYYNDMSDALETALGMNTSVTNTTIENISTENDVVNTAKTVTADTTFSMIGITTDATININVNGNSQSLIISPDMTVQNMIDILKGYGFTNSNISEDGIITIDGNDGVYIENMSSSLRNALNLPFVYAGASGSSAAYTTEVITGTSNSPSNVLTLSVPTAITEDTQIGQIDGFSQMGGLAVDDGEGNLTYLTSNADSTLGELFDELSNYGITGAVDEDGNVTFTSNGGQSVVATDDTNGSLLDTLKFGETTYTTTTRVEMTESNPINITPDTPVNGSSTLGDIKDSEGNTPSDYIIGVNGNEHTLSAEDTIDDVLQILKDEGLNATVNADGTITISSNSEFTLSGGLADALFGTDRASIVTGSITTSYTGESLEATDITTSTIAATNDTLLSSLEVTAGQYFIFENGVRIVANIGEMETIGSFRETLKTYGLETSLVNTAEGVKLLIKGSGNSYIATSTASNASNVVEKLFGEDLNPTYDYSNTLSISVTETNQVIATEDTLISKFDSDWGEGTLNSAGTLAITVGEDNYTITIGAGETFGSLMNKFQEIGVETSLDENGTLMLYTGGKDFNIDTSASTSNLLANLGLAYNADLGGYTASTEVVESTKTTTVEIEASAANFADHETKMGMLNISSGSLTIYKNGEKAVVQVDSEETFGDLQTRITNQLGDVFIRFDNGLLEFYSTEENATVTVGSSVDTSNLSAICGLRTTDKGTTTSSRELYRVNGDSILINSGLFRRGDVTEGTFVVGNAVFSIDNKTTLSSIISQINSSQEANATAYWDSVDGKFVIKSRATGATMINIEAGTSNFTDIMGFTNSEWNDDGSLKVTRLRSDAQEVGESAEFSINGTEFTSTSNTITSDISRIQGVTFNLKDVSNGETVTVTIEKDSDTVANAMEDIVKAYNDLIENVDKEIAMTGQLHDQTTLKLLRNQIRSLMTSSLGGNSVFKNFDAIGISTQTASANDVSTNNINVLHFDKEKFIEAYKTDAGALKQILVGTEDNLGILSRVENVIEQALSTGSGYFSSAENSFSRQIQNLDNKITKQLAAVERYKTRLEKKFNAMDMLISQMQNQYSSFLAT